MNPQDQDNATTRFVAPRLYLQREAGRQVLECPVCNLRRGNGCQCRLEVVCAACLQVLSLAPPVVPGGDACICGAVKHCRQCGGYAEGALCDGCAPPRRRRRGRNGPDTYLAVFPTAMASAHARVTSVTRHGRPIPRFN